MKKYFVSAGLVAVGAAGLQTGFAAPQDIIAPKFWNVSANLRGFYDDNINATPNNKEGSLGFEISPSISLNVPLQQTDFGLRYTYGAYYYQWRADNGQNPWDQSHQVDVWMDHKFDERWKMNLSDTFNYAQQPQLQNTTPTTAYATYRVDSNYMANHGNVELDTDWTRLFSTSLTYINGYFDYQNSGATVGGVAVGPPPYQQLNHTGTLGWQQLGAGGPSLAGLLNRIEQNLALDLKWNLQPETVAFVGYSFSWVGYNGNEPIAVVNYVTPALVPRSYVYVSSDRDSYTHYGYVGVQHQFTPNLGAQVRVGASYTDAYADPLYPTTSWGPYADLNATYTYLPGCYVQVGFTQDVGATDVVAPGANGGITQYAKNSVLYADVNHQITQKLSGSVIGRCQYSTFEGGAASSGNETAYGLGLNFHYQFNQHWGADTGYNYDDIIASSSIGGGYQRNQVYLGLNASY